MNPEKNYHNFELRNSTLKTTTEIVSGVGTFKEPGLDVISWEFLKDGSKILLCKYQSVFDINI